MSAAIDSRLPVAVEPRLPATLSLSMALHAGALGLWVYFSHLPKHEQTRILNDVELMVMAKPGPAVVAPRAASKPDTWNFLKMALPSIPKPLDVQVAKSEPKPMVEPVQKLEENRRKMTASLEALKERDPGHHAAPMPSLEDAGLKARLSRPKLAEAPKLEDVGTTRAPKALIEASALAEAQRAGPRPQQLSALAAAPESPRAKALAAPMALPAENSAPARSSGALSRRANLLPAEQATGRAGGRSGPMIKPQMDLPAPEKRQAQAMSEPKKATTSEG